jgi:HTH-type transcriptional regulator, transcriptional repressor of NAD biosynthesis genes
MTGRADAATGRGRVEPGRSHGALGGADAPARRWRHGLAIGKFRPPHLGHALLIETALARVERLTVVVCGDRADTIPVALRAAWLRELHPAAEVRTVDSTGADPHDSRLWASLTRYWLGLAPDVVFTSEGYGDVYARFLGAAHVCVDRARARVPISASRILARPLDHLGYLAPPVRAHFVLRVALLGAESTGKTTLARLLAERYRTAWVPEYGRTYSDGLLTRPAPAWATPDFVHIAAAQARLEDTLARHADRVLLCDTDPLTTALWHERYVGRAAPAVSAIGERRRYGLTFVCGDEIPWVDDGTRDRAEERPRLQRRILEELARLGRPFVSLDGPLDRRLEVAAGHIDAVLATGGAGPGADEARGARDMAAARAAGRGLGGHGQLPPGGSARC